MSSIGVSRPMGPITPAEDSWLRGSLHLIFHSPREFSLRTLSMVSLWFFLPFIINSPLLRFLEVSVMSISFMMEFCKSWANLISLEKNLLGLPSNGWMGYRLY